MNSWFTINFLCILIFSKHIKHINRIAADIVKYGVAWTLEAAPNLNIPKANTWIKQNYEHKVVAPLVLSEIAKHTSGRNVPTVSVALGMNTQGPA